MAGLLSAQLAFSQEWFHFVPITILVLGPILVWATRPWWRKGIAKMRHAHKASEASTMDHLGDGPSLGEGAADCIILVHGTFAREAEWARQGSALHSALSAHFQKRATIHAFKWSARNAHRARHSAAQDLAAFIRDGSGRCRRVALVGHSHGGNVALGATKLLDPPHRPAGIVCYGTPFFHVEPHSERRLEMAAKCIYVITAVLPMILLLFFVGNNVSSLLLGLALAAIIGVSLLVARAMDLPERGPRWAEQTKRWIHSDSEGVPVLNFQVARDEARGWLRGLAAPADLLLVARPYLAYGLGGIAFLVLLAWWWREGGRFDLRSLSGCIFAAYFTVAVTEFVLRRLFQHTFYSHGNLPFVSRLCCDLHVVPALPGSINLQVLDEANRGMKHSIFYNHPAVIEATVAFLEQVLSPAPGMSSARDAEAFHPNLGVVSPVGKSPACSIHGESAHESHE